MKTPQSSESERRGITYVNPSSSSTSRESKMLKSRITNDPLRGRGLETTEVVKKGEVVVEELPFAYGPKQSTGIICLGCYRELSFDEDGDSLDRCATCDWPLCSVCSADEAMDHKGECEIFSQARVHFAGNVGEDGVCTQLDCITVLRLVLEIKRFEIEILY